MTRWVVLSVYDPLSRILQQQTRYQTAHNDDAQALPLNQQTRRFSPDNRVHDPIRLQRNYRYNKTGELTDIQDIRHGHTCYGYDALGRITRAQPNPGGLKGNT